MDKLIQTILQFLPFFEGREKRSVHISSFVFSSNGAPPCLEISLTTFSSTVVVYSSQFPFFFDEIGNGNMIIQLLLIISCCFFMLEFLIVINRMGFVLSLPGRFAVVDPYG